MINVSVTHDDPVSISVRDGRKGKADALLGSVEVQLDSLEPQVPKDLTLSLGAAGASLSVQITWCPLDA
eukprot:CAMPEP_0206261130 /NCGR_PEP_ID=MMETSP0047_2-20121206/27477_1 /ASSEMBLY_ACC=CAM_ASM_000192 /TAXON_ID=195065 /ORGANISM="Chroomonas mesostigmatica_cf, Strain CCMP1168" /LENGTH=68 /DNA_ID=CAMNT_0053688297 /DNA_START=8 /DNA_END=214 /DNA_ORIENTATION=-